MFDSFEPWADTRNLHPVAVVVSEWRGERDVIFASVVNNLLCLYTSCISMVGNETSYRLIAHNNRTSPKTAAHFFNEVLKGGDWFDLCVDIAVVESDW